MKIEITIVTMCFLNYRYVQDNDFSIGETIKIIETTDNSNIRTSEIYTKYAVRFQKLN